MRSLKPFRKNDRGATAVLFSLSAVGLFCAAGVATDLGITQYRQTQIQDALDAAVIAGASSSLDPAIKKSTAEAFFNQNFVSTGTGLTDLNVSFTTNKTQISGSVVGKIPTNLMKVVGIDSTDIGIKSTATSNVSYEPLCFMAMHPTRKHTLELNDSVSVFAPDCNIYGNSNHENDVIDPHTSLNFLTGKYVAAVGFGHHVLENVTPPADLGAEQIDDPLVAMAMPAAGPCTQNNYVVSSSNTTLPPGHYCGGLKIQNLSNVTLQSNGSYFISGGTLDVNNSQLSGTDVTIFLTDASADVNLDQAKLNISAPKIGTFAGIAVYGARVNTNNTFTKSELNVHGVFYMPNGALVWENTGTPAATAPWSVFVVDGVSWIGNGTIKINFDRKNSDIPYPKQLIAMPRPGDVRLVN
jgi:Flp pilus assembly protein TadG